MLNSRFFQGKKEYVFGVTAVAVILCTVLLLTNLFGTSWIRVNSKDLMTGISPNKVDTETLSDDFKNSAAKFSIDLFKQSVTKGENSMISPLSVYLALAMTANGADGNTLKEFETVLGDKKIGIADIDKFCYSLVDNLVNGNSGKLNIANSIWFDKDKANNISKNFLQTNADYFGASAFKENFKDSQTVNNINAWVKMKTENLINKIIDKIGANTIMYLINTVYFDMLWDKEYHREDIHKVNFTTQNGKKKLIELMFSEEEEYLKDDWAQGFIKPYKDGKFSFAALLPNKGISIDDYVASLTGEKFTSLMKNKTDSSVWVAIPKFKTEYKNELRVPLQKMGLIDCFKPNANFGKLVKSNDIFIDKVIHKTFIQVDELGTKAGAVTEISLQTLSGGPPPPHEVILNRPFVYMIIDNSTGLPIFMGTMNDPSLTPS